MKTDVILDAMVSELLMGIKVEVKTSEIPGPGNWVSPPGSDRVWIRFDGYKVSPYSSDIKCAWEVIAKINSMTFSTRHNFKQELTDIVSRRISSSGVRIHPSEVILRVEPVDICIAALKAIGQDV